MSLIVEVEEALGPGVDFERDPASGLVARRARPARLWLGFDRAALAESDDGLGRRVPVLVALPASTFRGARIAVELTGAWRGDQGVILVGSVPGGPSLSPMLARIAGNVDSQATWLDRETAEREARTAYQRFRERRSHARISGGRAWRPSGTLGPELARFTTPHSTAEYSLSRLPPRFLRGLEGLLDDDERVLYWIERPILTDVSLVRRLRERIDRRAALLVLTDRQLLWIVDHAQPDQYLSDWGVDVELLPVERVVEAECAPRDGAVELRVGTPAGGRTYQLPAELEEEIRVMRDLLSRFTPSAARSLPRRRYRLDAIAFDADAAARFDQESVARRGYEAAAADGAVSAFLFSPSRPGQRSPAALILRPTAVELDVRDRRRAIGLADVVTINVTLSVLVGRLSVGPGVAITYPAPLADRGAAFVRLARRALANAS